MALALVILFQTFTHLGVRSPYLYSTEGLFDLEEPPYAGNMYGMPLGPRGEIIHFDSHNYWQMEFLFSGKHRGDDYGTVSRPAYPFLVSLFDNYLHPYHAGLLVNILFWFVAALMGYAGMRALDFNQWTAKTCSGLIATAPPFVNAAGQPMGYVVHYSLFIIFVMFILNIRVYGKSPLPFALITSFLLVLNDFAYEISGIICFVFLLGYGFTKIKWCLLAFITFIFLGFKATWNAIIIPFLISPPKPAPLASSSSQLTSAVFDISFSNLSSILYHIGEGFLRSAFYVLPVIAILGWFFIQRPVKRVTATLFICVSFPIFIMGWLFETLNMYNFYKTGRVVAFFMPVIFISCSALLETSLPRKILIGKSQAVFACILMAVSFILSNADIAGIRWFYDQFNLRQGF